MKVSNNCYYPLVPQDPAKVDASGNVQGSDLRGTPAYEHFVDSLSKHSDASTQSSSMNREQAQATVDAIRIKSGTILVVRCPDGQGGAARVVPSGVIPSNAVPSSVAQPDHASAQRSHGTVRESEGPWQCLGRLARQFFASFTDKETNDGNARQELREDIRDYDRHLNALVYASAM